MHVLTDSSIVEKSPSQLLPNRFDQKQNEHENNQQTDLASLEMPTDGVVETEESDFATDLDPLSEEITPAMLTVAKPIVVLPEQRGREKVSIKTGHADLSSRGEVTGHDSQAKGVEKAAEERDSIVAELLRGYGDDRRERIGSLEMRQLMDTADED